MTDTTRAVHRGRRRFLPVVWAASAVSAAVLVLGVNGTLSSWTSAVITNSSNTVATANAVVLKEVGPDGTATHTAQTCYSSDGSGNSYTCTNINKYGGAGTGITPLSPGDTRNIDVTFTNVGTANAASFKLQAPAIPTPNSCTQLPLASTAVTPNINNLCTAANELNVAVQCRDGLTWAAAGTLWGETVSGAPNALGTLTHTAALAPNASWTCRFTVSLASNASVTDAGITVTQGLVWTLAS